MVPLFPIVMYFLLKLSFVVNILDYEELILTQIYHSATQRQIFCTVSGATIAPGNLIFQRSTVNCKYRSAGWHWKHGDDLSENTSCMNLAAHHWLKLR